MKNRLTRITTRTGDSGSSGLADGSRHAKTDPVFAAMGDIDELNSVLGVAIADLSTGSIRDQLLTIQSSLFDLGTSLAIPGRDPAMTREIGELEAWTSEFNSKLGPLQNFVLPGGTPTAAVVHMARAVCRRAERSYWQYFGSRAEGGDATGAVYLNRLSDYLFVLARTLNSQAEQSETVWQPRSSSE